MSQMITGSLDGHNHADIRAADFHDGGSITGACLESIWDATRIANLKQATDRRVAVQRLLALYGPPSCQWCHPFQVLTDVMKAEWSCETGHQWEADFIE